MRSTLALMALLAAGSCRQTAAPEVAPEPRAPQAPQTARTAPQAQGPAVVIHTRGGPVTVGVEVARTDAQRMRGLMYRRDMPEDRGMIFMFREPSHQVFWMHNTLLPLDMIFIRPDRTILGVVRNATPETDDQRQVPGDSQYVLEVNGGWCARHGVADGDRVEFVDVPPAME